MASNAEVALEALAKKLAEIERRLPGAETDRERDVRMEKFAREHATRDPGMILGGDVVDFGGRGFLSARKAVAMGKTSRVPYWDDRTEKRFQEFSVYVSTGDRQMLRKNFPDVAKTWGDQSYTESTTTGGYLVPDEFRGELVRAIYVKSLMLPKVRIVPMNSDVLYLPSVTAENSAAWGTINTQLGDTAATLGQVSLTAKKLFCLSVVPNELMQDSMIGMGAFLADEFSNAHAKVIDSNILRGDTGGSAPYSAFNGWASASGVQDVAGTTGDSAPGCITFDHLVEVVSSIEDPDGAEWFMPNSAFRYVRSLTDEQSRPLVDLDKSFAYGILGYPVNLTARMVAIGSVAAEGAVALFGNPRYVIVGDRLDLRIESSEHVRFDYDQTVFRSMQRLAIAVDSAVSGSLAKLTRGE